LKHSLTESARVAGQTIQPLVAETMAGIARETTALQQRVADGVQAQLDGLIARFDATAGTVADTWTQALASHERSGQTVAGELRGALQAFADTFAQRSATLVDQVGATVTALHTELSARDDARQSAQSEAVQAMAASLRSEWQAMGEEAGSRERAIVDRLDEAARVLAAGAEAQVERSIEAVASRQQLIVDRLDETARTLAASTQAQASRTIEQVSALMHTAAEAPRVAAEVIGELRQALSASIARDNAALDERNRIMETLRGLLDAINHASTEQRQAIDALVASSASALQRA